jgi:hypothetical protein
MRIRILLVILMRILIQILASLVFADPDPNLIFHLKGPKHEIFVAGIFAQIRPIWIGDLGTRPKNPTKNTFGALDLPLFL